jgi:hypothetical protein
MQPRHGGGQAPNPIAENNPTLSVESQSIRRALRQLISHITGSRVTLPNVDAMADELGNLQTRTREATQERTAGVAAAIVQDETVQLDRSNLLTSGYNEAEEFQRHHARRENPDDVAVVSGPVSNRVDRPTLQRIANAPDPYADPPVDRRGDPSELTTEKLNAEVTGDSLDVVKSGDVDPFVDARAPLITPAIRDAQRAENRSFVDELEEQSRDEERFVREMSDALGEPTPGNTLHVAAVASDPQSETTIARASLELTPEPIAYPLRELPKKACFSCGQMVSGPNTSQHDPRCIYYKQPAE